MAARRAPPRSLTEYRLADPQLAGGGLEGGAWYNNFSDFKNAATNVKNKIVNGTNALVQRNESGLSTLAANTLAQFRDAEITAYSLFKAPIASGIKTALEVVGNTSFDSVYHLGSLLTVHHPVTFAYATLLLDKQARLHLEPWTTGSPPGATIQPVPIPRMTLGELFDKTRAAMGDKFIPYDPKSNNCQDFTLAVLRATGASTPETEAFAHPNDANALFDKSRKELSAIAPALTQVGAVSEGITDRIKDFHKVWSGSGLAGGARTVGDRRRRREADARTGAMWARIQRDAEAAHERRRAAADAAGATVGIVDRRGGPEDGEDVATSDDEPDKEKAKEKADAERWATLRDAFGEEIEAQSSDSDDSDERAEASRSRRYTPYPSRRFARRATAPGPAARAAMLVRTDRRDEAEDQRYQRRRTNPPAEEEEGGNDDAPPERYDTATLEPGERNTAIRAITSARHPDEPHRYHNAILEPGERNPAIRAITSARHPDEPHRYHNAILEPGERHPVSKWAADAYGPGVKYGTTALSALSIAAHMWKTVEALYPSDAKTMWPRLVAKYPKLATPRYARVASLLHKAITTGAPVWTVTKEVRPWVGEGIRGGSGHGEESKKRKRDDVVDLSDGEEPPPHASWSADDEKALLTKYPELAESFAPSSVGPAAAPGGGPAGGPGGVLGDPDDDPDMLAAASAAAGLPPPGEEAPPPKKVKAASQAGRGIFWFMTPEQFATYKSRPPNLRRDYYDMIQAEHDRLESPHYGTVPSTPTRGARGPAYHYDSARITEQKKIDAAIAKLEAIKAEPSIEVKGRSGKLKNVAPGRASAIAKLAEMQRLGLIAGRRVVRNQFDFTDAPPPEAEDDGDDVVEDGYMEDGAADAEEDEDDLFDEEPDDDDDRAPPVGGSIFGGARGRLVKLSAKRKRAASPSSSSSGASKPSVTRIYDEDDVANGDTEEEEEARGPREEEARSEESESSVSGIAGEDESDASSGTPSDNSEPSAEATGEDDSASSEEGEDGGPGAAGAEGAEEAEAQPDGADVHEADAPAQAEADEEAPPQAQPDGAPGGGHGDVVDVDEANNDVIDLSDDDGGVPPPTKKARLAGSGAIWVRI